MPHLKRVLLRAWVLLEGAASRCQRKTPHPTLTWLDDLRLALAKFACTCARKLRRVCRAPAQQQQAAGRDATHYGGQAGGVTEACKTLRQRHSGRQQQLDLSAARDTQGRQAATKRATDCQLASFGSSCNQSTSALPTPTHTGEGGHQTAVPVPCVAVVPLNVPQAATNVLIKSLTCSTTTFVGPCSSRSMSSSSATPPGPSTSAAAQ